MPEQNSDRLFERLSTRFDLSRVRSIGGCAQVHITSAVFRAIDPENADLMSILPITSRPPFGGNTARPSSSHSSHQHCPFTNNCPPRHSPFSMSRFLPTRRHNPNHSHSNPHSVLRAQIQRRIYPSPQHRYLKSARASQKHGRPPNASCSLVPFWPPYCLDDGHL